MRKVIFCRGIQGSGKSTWAKEWVNENPEQRIRISWDDLRNMCGKYWVPNREHLITHASIMILEEAMVYGYDVVIDNMNLSEHSKKPFLNIIEKHNKYVNDSNNQLMYNYEIKYKDFKTPIEVCIERDYKRENPIGAQIITSTYNRYKDFYEQDM